MKLKNKKTGETGYYLHTHRDHKTGVLKVAVLKDGVPFSEFKPYEPIYDYDSLAELNEEWEDYEEPTRYWYIDFDGDVLSCDEGFDKETDGKRKQIGNYFETKEEAEKAAEKLKALKRLKDKGVEIENYDCYGETNTKGEFSGEVVVTIGVPQEVDKYLFMLLFGGEE